MFTAAELKTLHPKDLAKQLHMSKWTLVFVGLPTSFLLSAYFLVSIYAGTLNMYEWTPEDWFNAGPAVGITLLITIAQIMLYMSGIQSNALIIAKIVFIAVQVIGEVSQTGNRETANVAEKSEQSTLFKKSLEHMDQAASALTKFTSGGDTRLAEAKGALVAARGIVCRHPEGSKKQKTCLDWKDKQVRTAEGEITTLEIVTTTRANGANDAYAMAKASAEKYSYNERFHHFSVRLLNNVTGVSFLVAALLFVSLFIAGFEYGLHFLGSVYAVTKSEMRRRGLDDDGTPMEAPEDAKWIPETTPQGAMKNRQPEQEQITPEQHQNTPGTPPAKTPEPTPEQAGTPENAPESTAPVKAKTPATDIEAEAKKTFPLIQQAHKEGVVQFLVSTHVGNHVNWSRIELDLQPLDVSDTLKVATLTIEWLIHGIPKDAADDLTIDDLSEAELKAKLYGYQGDVTGTGDDDTRFERMWIEITASADPFESIRKIRTRHAVGVPRVQAIFQIAQLFKIASPKNRDGTRDRLTTLSAQEAAETAEDIKAMILEHHEEQKS